ncbi:MAG: ComF family protein [Alphaproteobacteria bacterium]|nr:ComF family protein [Alphaproteobacteria bacterium]
MASISAIRFPVMALSQWALDKLYPPLCPSCHVEVAAQGHLCGACFQDIHMIAAPLCAQCGVPFAVDMGADALCPDCLDRAASYRTARSALVYGEVVGTLIKQLKYHDQMQGLTRFAQWMAQVAPEEVDVIIPVPLHWRRLLTRTYNQAAWLAYGLSHETGVACAPHFLKRVRHMLPQARMTRAERQRNMKRAFLVPNRYKSDVEGKRILLVDDVMTTGSTIEACADALKIAGAAEVHAVALARAVRNL